MTEEFGETLDYGPGDEHPARFGDEPALPKAFAGYEIIELLGRGGMGIVYKARQKNPDRLVALKVIRSDLVSQEMLKRFQIETATLGRLQHPGIARIYEAGTASVDGFQQPFFAMEFVEGRPLADWVREAEPDDERIIELMVQVCDAVQHAHQRGIIHRDLKPDNILVDGRGQPRILDFGLARSTDSDLAVTQANTTAGQILGTLPYMAPEQASGAQDAIDTRCDVYALGVIIFEVLAGRLPLDFKKGMLHEAVRIIQEDEPKRLSSFNRSCRGDLDTIVRKAMEKEKEQRYDSASALADDLGRYLNDEPISARPPGTWYQVAKFARRNRMLVAGVTGIFIALIIGIIGTTIGMTRAAIAKRSAEAQAILLEAALGREQEQSQLAREAKEDADRAAASANRSYGTVLFEAALRSFDEGAANQGKVLIARALEVNPEIDPRSVQMHSIAQPEFPIKPFVGADGKPIGAVRLAFSGNGRYLFYQNRNVIRRYDLEKKTDRVLPHSGTAIGNIVPSQSGRLVAVSDHVGQVALMDVENERIIGRDKLEKWSKWAGNPTAVHTVIDPGEKVLAYAWTAGADETVHFRKTKDMSPYGENVVMPLKYHDAFSNLVYSKDGHTLTYGRGRDSYWVRGLGSEREVKKLDVGSSNAMDMHLGTYKWYVATGGSGSVHHHEHKRSSNQLIWSATVSRYPVTHVQYIYNGNYLVYGCANGESGIIDVNRQRLLQRFPVGKFISVNESADFLIAGGMRIDLGWAKGRVAGRRKSPKRDPNAPVGLARCSPKFLAALFEKGVFADRETYKDSKEFKNGRYLSNDDGQQECFRTVGRMVAADWKLGIVRDFKTKLAPLFGMFTYIEDGQRIFNVGLTKGTTLTGAEYSAEILNLATGDQQSWALPAETWASSGYDLTEDRKTLISRDAQRAIWLYTVPELKRLGSFFPKTSKSQYAGYDAEHGTVVVQHGQTSYHFDFSTLYDPPPSYAAQSKRLGYKVENGKAVSSY